MGSQGPRQSSGKAGAVIRQGSGLAAAATVLAAASSHEARQWLGCWSHTALAAGATHHSAFPAAGTHEARHWLQALVSLALAWPRQSTSYLLRRASCLLGIWAGNGGGILAMALHPDEERVICLCANSSLYLARLGCEL